MKTIIRWLTAAALLLSLWGCHQSPSPTTAGEQVAFTRSFVSVIPEAQTKQQGQFPLALANDNTLTFAYEAVDNGGGSATVFCRVDLATNEEKPLYRVDYEYGVTPVPYAASVSDSADSLWIVDYQEGDLMYGGMTPDRFMLRVIDLATGESRREWNLSERWEAQYSHRLLVAGDDTAYLVTECAGEDGNDMVLTCANAATGVLSDGYTLESMTTLPMLVTLHDGRVAVVDSAANSLLPFAKGSITPEAVLKTQADVTAERFFDGGDDEAFLYVADGALYGGGIQPLMNFSTWGVNIAKDTLRDVTLHDGVCQVLVEEDGLLGVYTLTPCTAEESAPVLRLAGYQVSSGVQAAVTAFNRTYFDYTAQIEDYTQYDDGNSNAVYEQRAGVTKMNTELLAGSNFDILYLNEYLSADALVRQGALLDLYPLLDAGGEVTRDTFVEGILEKTEQDGHLYHLSTAFGIRTMLTDRRVIGDCPSLTLADWHALQAAHPASTVTDMSEEQFLNYLSNIAAHDFITDGRAAFDTDTFIGYLETMATLDSADEKLTQLVGNYTVADYATLADGRFLLMPFYLRNFNFYQRALSNLVDGAQFTGYPTENGVGHTLSFANTLGILSTSDKQEAAWKFLQLCIKENTLGFSEGELEQPGFPMDRASFEMQLAY